MLFKSTEEIKNFCGTLNKSTKFETLRGCVDSAEEKHLIPLIGKELYSWIDTAYNGTDPLTANQTKLLKAIQRPLAFYTVLEAAPYLLANVGDAGVAEANGQNVTGMRQWTYFHLKNKLAVDADTFAETLLEFL